MDFISKDTHVVMHGYDVMFSGFPIKYNISVKFYNGSLLR